jgi:CRISPR system Cascade subunit CasA
VTAALHRFLLAVLHRVFGPSEPDIWVDLWLRGYWDQATLETYFTQWHPRFNLFDPKHPFYQTANPPLSLGLKSVSKLAPEMAAGNNATLFDHTLDTTPLSFSASEVARRLVAAQAFSVGGGQSGIAGKYFSHGACTKGILFLLQGKNLFETLVLNLVLYDHYSPIPSSDKDRPAWEMDDPLSPDRHVPLGYLDYLTWQSRLIKLIPVETDGLLKVNQMYFSQGLWLQALIESPLHSLRKSKEAGRFPLTFDEDRVLWRDSAALLNLEQSDKMIEPPAIFNWVANFVGDEVEGLLHQDQVYQYVAVGLKTDEKNAADVKFYRYERMPLPLILLKKPRLLEILRQALQKAEDADRILYFAGRDMAQWLVSPKDKKKAQRDDWEPLLKHLNLGQRYWGSLEIPFQEFIRHLTDEPEGAMKQWGTRVIKAARTAFTQGATGLDDPIRGMKATVLARGELERGLSRILSRETKKQEEL